MPYASLFTLHRYGPAAGSMFTQGQATAVAGASAAARAVSVVPGIGSMPLARPTRLVGSTMIASGIGLMPSALPKGRARAAAIIRIGTLSQDDVTGGVLTAPVEGGLTLRDVLRVLLAVAAGKTTISGSAVAFRDQADTRNRVAATMTGSTRTTTTIDPS